MDRKKLKLILISFISISLIIFISSWYFFYQWPYNLFQKYTFAYVNDIAVCPSPWQEPYLKKGFYLNAKKAKAGNLNAQFNQAIAYLGNIGVKENQQIGISLIQQTAKEGLPIAEATYGYLLDPKFIGANNGFRWYQKAAMQDDPFGQMYLATYYIQKTNDPTAQTNAFKLFMQSAKKLGISKYYLGNAYYAGIGTEANQSEAIKWFKSAFNDSTVGVETKALIANQLTSIYDQDANAKEQANYWSDQAIKLSQQNCQKIIY